MFYIITAVCSDSFGAVNEYYSEIKEFKSDDEAEEYCRYLDEKYSDDLGKYGGYECTRFDKFVSRTYPESYNTVVDTAITDLSDEIGEDKTRELLARYASDEFLEEFYWWDPDFDINRFRKEYGE